MCGIAAVIGGERLARESMLTRLLTRLSHRGEPHLQNELRQETGYALGCNRLAIVSPEEAKQPTTSRDQTVVLVLNGEIYNFRELANRYIPNDVSLCDQGDSRVVAELLANCSSSIVGEFDGMFAMIWRQGDQVFAARDHIGIKPLYIARARQGVLLASEIKALAPEDAVREIDCVSPGTILKFETDVPSSSPRVSSRKYFELDDIEEGDLSENDLRDAIERSVLSRIHTHGPTGVYLSGGVDSSGVFAFARRTGKEIVPLVLGTQNSSDRRAAERLLREFDCDAIVRDCPPEEEQFEDIIETIRVAESFEPNVVRSTSLQRQLAILTKEAKLRVVLCGEGADEVFCGYPEFAVAGGDWHSLRMRFVRDLHRTQLQRVDRAAMSLTREVRVPLLSREIVTLALSSRRGQDFLAFSSGALLNKACLRHAFSDVLPRWCWQRPKVAILEGCGMRGNDPQTGMFREFADAKISKTRYDEIRRSYPEWSIDTPEEAYYFEIFCGLGYHKAKFMKQRVTACGINCDSIRQWEDSQSPAADD